MTAFETWLTQLVEVLILDTPEVILAISQNVPVEMKKEIDSMCLELSRRIAIGLVQARALECRHLASEIAINFAGIPFATIMAERCWDRSRKLEAIGMQLAQQYPPIDGNEKMVCRCAMDHKEIQQPVREPIKNPSEYDGTEAETAIWVCSHCKLPKHGSAAQQTMVVQ